MLRARTRLRASRLWVRRDIRGLCSCIIKNAYKDATQHSRKQPTCIYQVGKFFRMRRPNHVPGALADLRNVSKYFSKHSTLAKCESIIRNAELNACTITYPSPDNPRLTMSTIPPLSDDPFIEAKRALLQASDVLDYPPHRSPSSPCCNANPQSSRIII